MRLGEEAITNLLLLDLFEQGSRVFHFKQTSRPEESMSGVDFELWIGSRIKGWLRFAIQAKKIDVKTKTGRYSSLAYKPENSNRKQIDLLEDYARVKHAAPLYCLYNHTADAKREHWHCCTEPADLEELGCTVTPSINIRNAINERGTRKFDNIHKNESTFPLKCLVCPKVWDSPGFMSQNAPDRAALNVSSLFGPRHEVLPPALGSDHVAAVADENGRGGSRISLSADDWRTEEAMAGSNLQARTGVGRPKAVAVIEIDDLGGA